MSSSHPQLEPALKLLRDSKDESKFVGLLLICKALAPPPAPAAAAAPESAAPDAAASAARAAHAAAAASAAPTPSPAPAASSPEVISIRVSEHISGLRSSVPGPDYGRDSDDDDEDDEGARPEGSAAADAYEDEEDEDSTTNAQSRAPKTKKKPEPPAPAFDTDILQTIFDAVGYRFLARLLKTTRGIFMTDSFALCTVFLRMFTKFEFVRL
jgi:hypothetical protein